MTGVHEPMTAVERNSAILRAGGDPARIGSVSGGSGYTSRQPTRLTSRRHSISAPRAEEKPGYQYSRGNSNRDLSRASDNGPSRHSARVNRRLASFQLARAYSNRSLHSSSDHHKNRERTRSSDGSSIAGISGHTLSSETENLMHRFSLAKMASSDNAPSTTTTTTNSRRRRSIPRSLSTRSLQATRQELLNDKGKAGRLTRTLSKRSLEIRRRSVESITPSLRGFLDKVGRDDRSGTNNSADDDSNIAPMADDSDEGIQSRSVSPEMGRGSGHSSCRGASELSPYSSKQQTTRRRRRSTAEIDSELAEIEMAFGANSNHSGISEFDNSEIDDGSSDDEESFSEMPSELMNDNSQQSRLLS